MQFGLSFLPDVTDKSHTATTYFHDVIALSVLADEKGLSTIKMTEHYLHPYGGYCPSPLIFLSAVAAVTTRIRLMTGCLLPVFHHPIALAAETAMVDAISNGRLDVGFARAYLPHEFEAFGVSMEESRQRFVETIAAVKALWCDDLASYQGVYHQFHALHSLPSVMQLPHPPIWIAAVNSRQSFTWAGEQGYRLLVTPPLGEISVLRDHIHRYQDAFRPSRVSPHPEIAISMPLYLAETDALAEAEGAQYLSRYMATWADATSAWSSRSSSDYPGYTGLSQVIQQHAFVNTRDNFQAVVGAPESAIQRIQTILELLPLTQILWQIDFGGQQLPTMSRTLQHLIDDVIPRIG